MLVNLTSESYWKERVIFPAHGKVESVIETRTFFHWFWFKKVKRITISLFYLQNIEKEEFKTVECWDERDLTAPKEISVFSNELNYKPGDSIELEMGYAKDNEQLYRGAAPFAFKLETMLFST